MRKPSVNEFTIKIANVNGTGSASANGMLMKSPSQGGDTIVHALCSTDLEGKGGTYMRHYKEKPSNYVTSSAENQKKLWDVTMKILKIKEFGATWMSSPTPPSSLAPAPTS